MKPLRSTQISESRSLRTRVVIGAVIIAAVTWTAFRITAPSSTVARVGALISPSVLPASLTGGVQSSGSGELAAATVCAYGTSATTRLDRYCAVTDAQGNYRLLLAAGQFSVTASADSHASVTSTVTIDDSQTARLDFTLESRNPTIAGVVSSASGERIVSARVAVYQGSSLVSNVTTNDTGGFTAWTPPGELVVKVDAEGFGPAIVRTVAPTMDVLVTLYPGNIVSGRVLLDGSLQPVPNVHVTAVGGADRIVSELRDAAVQTDERGNFTFPNLTSGAWTLTVADRRLWGMSPKPILVTSGRVEQDIILLVQPAGEISGRFVLSGSEQPCPSGRMQLISEATALKAAARPDGEIIEDEPEPNKPAPVPLFTATTGENGVIRFDAVPLGVYRLGPICDQHQLTGGPRKLEIAGDTIEQRWEFSAGLGLTVRVVDEATRPIENAAVAISLQNVEGLSRAKIAMSQRSGRTDAQGSYRLGALQPGQYEVSARYSALNGNAIVSEVVNLQGGSEAVPITLTLPGAGKLRIHAHTPAGISISRVLFFALDSHNARYEGTYSGDGRFLIGPLPGGSYRVFGYDNKNPKIPLNNGSEILIAGAEQVDVDFNYDAPTAFLQGRVVDSSGQPLPGVYVRAVSATLDEDDERFSSIQAVLHGGQEQMTDQAGAFRIHGLKNQAVYDVYLDHPSGVKEQRNGVSVGTFVEVAFPASASFIGSVTDANGRPVDKFDVVYDSIANRDSKSQSLARTGGRFKFENVYPGPLHITVYSDDGEATAVLATKISPGQLLDVGQVVLTAANKELAAQADR